MPDQLQTEVKINGIDIAANLLTWRVEKKFGQAITECMITTSAGVLSTVSGLSNGMTITIKRGATGTEQFVFEGIIDEINEKFPNVVVMGKDRLLELLRNEITKSYDKDIDVEAGVGSEIFKDMVNTFTPLTADSTSVQSTGAVEVLTKFICNHVDVFQRALVLADIFDFQFYYDPDDSLVHFEPKGFIDKTGDPLEVGVNVSKTLKFQFDNTQCVNDITVEGATQETEVPETFDGTGAQDVFVLAFVPIVVKVFVDGVEQTLGVPDSTSTFRRRYRQTVVGTRPAPRSHGDLVNRKCPGGQ